MLGKKKTKTAFDQKNLIPTVWWHCHGLGLLCCLGACATYDQLINSEFSVILDSARGECEAIC